MQTTDYILLVAVLLLSAVLWSYRRAYLNAIGQRDAWKAKAQHWFDKATEYQADAEWCQLVLGWGKTWREKLDVPSDLPIGSAANPILTPNGDTARLGFLRDFCPKVLP